jgi:DNA-binding transcriptional ArsR family regulator
MGPHQTLQPDRKAELLAVLANARRRAILTHLRNAPAERVTIRTLTDELQNHTQVSDDRTATTIVHSDLPSLDDAGILEYDHRSKTARYRAHPHVERLLTVITDL